MHIQNTPPPQSISTDSEPPTPESAEGVSISVRITPGSTGDFSVVHANDGASLTELVRRLQLHTSSRNPVDQQNLSSGHSSQLAQATAATPEALRLRYNLQNPGEVVLLSHTHTALELVRMRSSPPPPDLPSDIDILYGPLAPDDVSVSDLHEEYKREYPLPVESQPSTVQVPPAQRAPLDLQAPDSDGWDCTIS